MAAAAPAAAPAKAASFDSAFNSFFERVIKPAIETDMKHPKPSDLATARNAMHLEQSDTDLLMTQRGVLRYARLYDSLNERFDARGVLFQTNWADFIRAIGTHRFSLNPATGLLFDITEEMSPSTPLSSYPGLQTLVYEKQLHLPALGHFDPKVLQERALTLALSNNRIVASVVCKQYSAAIRAYVEDGAASAWVPAPDRLRMRIEVPDVGTLPDAYADVFAAPPRPERPVATKPLRDAVAAILRANLSVEEKATVRQTHSLLLTDIEKRYRDCAAAQSQAEQSLAEKITRYATQAITVRARLTVRAQMQSDAKVVGGIHGTLAGGVAKHVAFADSLIKTFAEASTACKTLDGMISAQTEKLKMLSPPALGGAAVTAAWLGYAGSRIDFCDAEMLVRESALAFGRDAPSAAAAAVQPWSVEAFLESLEAERLTHRQRLAERFAHPIPVSVTKDAKADIASLTLPVVERWNQYWTAEAQSRTALLRQIVLAAEHDLSAVEFAAAPRDKFGKGMIVHWIFNEPSKSSEFLKRRALTVPCVNHGDGLVGCYLDELLVPVTQRAYTLADMVRCALVVYACSATQTP